MAHPLEAHYGRDTWAQLARCSRCGKAYDGLDGWRTVKAGAGHLDIWCLLCDRCRRKET